MSAPTFSYNRDLLDDQYTRFRQNPGTVDPTWQAFFAGVEFAGNGAYATTPGQMNVDTRLQTGAVRLITAYRDLGHLVADVNPLADAPPADPWLISLDRFHLTPDDLPQPVDASMYFGLNGSIPLGELIGILRETYCRTIGVEYMHIQDMAARRWLAERMEPIRNRPNLSGSRKLRALMTVHQAELFEKFLHTKFVGQKRFSLEGGETLIPVMDAIIEKAGAVGVQEVVIGMAHRGRLNVLTNILRKPFAEVFNEFEDRYLPDATDGDGDVKYHMGFSSDVDTISGHKVHLTLTPNPSHLEIVNPVVQGRVRAKQRLFGDVDRERGVPLLVHGDAAFAGQGPVTETLNMANLAGYRVGGTLHVVVNNQIGFTTNPRDARSTQYCTDVAKFIQAPIFHVNAEDVEACVYVAELAMEYRQTFKSDVVIDMLCYRRWGHNEGDEPSFTQPLMYKKITAKPTISTAYTNRLVESGSLARDAADAIDAEFKAQLESQLKEVKEGPPRKKGMKGYAGRWAGLSNKYNHTPADTGVPVATLERIADAISSAPDGFTIHPKLKDILGKRTAAVRERKPLDWGTAEALAFGSLVLDGIMVRLSGQDCRRGTFSHRHSVLTDYETGQTHCPLDTLDPDQARFLAYDSSLSEAGVLGFEYGFSLDAPDALVLWEAQFGDFANGAQVVIDQFIASGESKWNRSSGLVLLLPHGYEGAGPEHSSARPERFLQLCADDNMQVVNCTTPAQIFHALRRQVKRTFRKPLVVMTPKSLLRHPQAVSQVEELVSGRFQEVLDDTLEAPDRVRRVLLCSGKVYYELLERRTAEQTDQVAIIRLEQLYPWPEEQLKAVLAKYRRAQEWKWVQEESQNMGGWSFVEPRLRAMRFDFQYIGRDASASPATGSKHVHDLEQADLIEKAFVASGAYQVTADHAAQKKVKASA